MSKFVFDNSRAINLEYIYVYFFREELMQTVYFVLVQNASRYISRRSYYPNTVYDSLLHFSSDIQNSFWKTNNHNDDVLQSD